MKTFRKLAHRMNNQWKKTSSLWADKIQVLETYEVSNK